MQHLEYQEQEVIPSQNAQHQRKLKKFKEYLVSSGCVMHFVKFMLGLRNKQIADDSIPNQDVLQMFKQYIGAVDIDPTEHNSLKAEIDDQKKLNQSLKNQIQTVKSQILNKKAQIAKAEEQKRLKQQEQAKNPKKAGKK